MNDDAYIIASALSPRAVASLKRYGIDTVDQIKANYPEKLLRTNGFGMHSLRAVESAFFLGKKYKPHLDVGLTERKISVLSEELAQYLRGKPFGGQEGLR